MKNIISRNWMRARIVAFEQLHVNHAHKKKPAPSWIVPVYATIWVPNKPGKNSWIARREK
jgi:hypothetical protein